MRICMCVGLENYSHFSTSIAFLPYTYFILFAFAAISNAFPLVTKHAHIYANSFCARVGFLAAHAHRKRGTLCSTRLVSLRYMGTYTLRNTFSTGKKEWGRVYSSRKCVVVIFVAIALLLRILW